MRDTDYRNDSRFQKQFNRNGARLAVLDFEEGKIKNRSKIRKIVAGSTFIDTQKDAVGWFRSCGYSTH